MIKQVIFTDSDGITNGGIMLENGDIVCMCCGGLFPADEFEDMEIEIVKVFDSWISLTDELLNFYK